MNEAITTTIGCDLGEKKSELCVLQAAGELKRVKLKTSEPAFRAYFSEVKPAAHVVVEVGAPPELKPALQPIFTTLEKLHEQIREYDRELVKMSKRYPDVEVVGAINGVGVLTALVFLLTLEDKQRFEKSRAVGAFIGLRPRKDQSGDSDKQLRITKAGDPFLRRLLVCSANYILIWMDLSIDYFRELIHVIAFCVRRVKTMSDFEMNATADQPDMRGLVTA